MVFFFFCCNLIYLLKYLFHKTKKQTSSNLRLLSVLHSFSSRVVPRSHRDSNRPNPTLRMIKSSNVDSQDSPPRAKSYKLLRHSKFSFPSSLPPKAKGRKEKHKKRRRIRSIYFPFLFTWFVFSSS